MSNQNCVNRLTHAKKTHQTGKTGEELAERFLMGKGFRLIEKNFRVPGAEIDLIMENEDIVLFVEVKTRTNNNFGEPEDALNYNKKKKIIYGIKKFIMNEGVTKKWRCDLIAVIINKHVATIKHYLNIFAE
jgi:putative endonuclease